MTLNIHPADRKSIVLVGMMGAGKTTTGFGLAQRLNIKFVDSDREIEKRENGKIADIFSMLGEEKFKTLEMRTIDNILDSTKPQVLSIGGNAFDNEKIRIKIKEKAISVFLEVDLETLIERVMRKKTRPLLELGDKREIMIDLYNKKIDLYRKCDILINTTYLNRETSIGVIIKSIVTYMKNFDEQ
jgi:shikimate kinase